jgi:hypothetical protein
VFCLNCRICSTFVVLLYSTPQHISILHVTNRILRHIHSFISNPVLTYSYSPGLHCSICKWVNWVMQCFTNPYPKPKCKFILFLSNCCHTYSIVLLLHYLTHIWFKSHESFSNLYLAISLLPQHHNKSNVLNQNLFQLFVLFDYVTIVWCVYVVLFLCYSLYGELHA